MWNFKDYYQKNREYHIKRTKEYYRKNRNKVLQKAKERNFRNREIRCSYTKQYALTHKGHKLVCSNCQKTFYNLHSYQKFCSRNCWNKWRIGKFRGENSYGWKGGINHYSNTIRKSLEFRNWRKAVFERDDYTCQNCGDKTFLHPHHFKSFTKYPKLRFVVSNGITFCVECHFFFHKLFKHEPIK